MTEASGDVVLFERVNTHIAIITLNRPDKRNAVNGEVSLKVWNYLQEIENDRSLWVGILASSNDKVFCAGADLSEISAGRGHTIPHPIGGFAGVVDAPRSKPLIAAVRGSAYGGGCELSLACDLRICGESTQFGLPEVARGLIAGAGGLYRMPRAVPQALAMELIATGAPLSSAKALQFGLVSRVVPDAQVREEAIKLAGEICANSPIAVAESLRIARQAIDRSVPELRELSRAAGARVSATKDAREGPRAFLEKRKPNWSGE